MIYLDTSVLVALFTNEASAKDIAGWYAGTTQPLLTSDWCLTEFASALALKQRTGQLTRKQGNTAWKAFSEFCTEGLRLLPVDRAVFTEATRLVRQSDKGLRAGDALHLAAALHVRAKELFTLDARLALCAREFRLDTIHP